jgi:hypothetical protein
MIVMVNKDWGYLLFIDDEPSSLYMRREFAKLFIGTVVLSLVAVSIGIFYADKYINYLEFTEKEVFFTGIIKLSFLTLICAIIMLLLTRCLSFLFEIDSWIGFFLGLIVIFPTLIKIYTRFEIINFSLLFIGFLYVWGLYNYFFFTFFEEIYVSSKKFNFLDYNNYSGFTTFYFFTVLICWYPGIFVFLSYAAIIGVLREEYFFEKRKGLILIKKINDQEMLAFIALKTNNYDIGEFATNKINDELLLDRIKREAKLETLRNYVKYTS